MADLTYTQKSTVRRDAGSQVPGKGDAGKLNYIASTVEFAAGSAGVTAKLCRVPSKARMSGLSKLYWDDLATTGSPTFDIGFASVNSNITSDPDALNDGLAVSSAGSAVMVKDAANYGKQAWEFVSGVTSDPGGFFDIYVILADAATTTAGTVTSEVLYSLD